MRIDFSYDGSAFHGYAYQNDLRTVQGQLQRALKILTQQDITLTVAGRTDAGVHAKHQVVHFDVELKVLFKIFRINWVEVLEQINSLNIFKINISGIDRTICGLENLGELPSIRSFFSDDFFDEDLQVFVKEISTGADIENNLFGTGNERFEKELELYKNSLIDFIGLNKEYEDYLLNNVFKDFLKTEDCLDFNYSLRDKIFIFKVIVHILEHFKIRLNNVLAMLDKSRILHGQENKPKSDVLIHKLRIVPQEFDARFSALSRKYVYTVSDLKSFRDVFRRNNVLWHDGYLDVDLMCSAAEKMLGEHDFLSYCKPRQGATTIRTLKKLNVSRNSFDEIEIFVEADAFCHSMVRSIVGVLILIGQGVRKPCWGRYLLDNPSRSHGVNIAPAHGLALVKVEYPSLYLLGEQAQKAKVKRVLNDYSVENCCD